MRRQTIAPEEQEFRTEQPVDETTVLRGPDLVRLSAPPVSFANLAQSFDRTPRLPQARVDPTRFRRVVRIPFSLTTAPQLAVKATAGWRTYLFIRNASTSAGNVVIDFDNAPAVATAAVELAPLGQVLWDSVVPQGDVYIVSLSTSICVVSFSIGPFPDQGTW